jgi:N-acetylmuramoyl-L-alanine amidase
LTAPRKQSVVTLLLLLSSLACLPAKAQAPAAQQPQTSPTPSASIVPPQPKPSRTLILLDPAHGGPDTGARLPGNLFEKDITLAFNNRLRAALSASNFAVISARTSDPGTVFTTDQRAEIANHDRPAVCLVLHATGSGSGIHIFTSALTPRDPSARPTYLLHWNTAQIPSIPASRAIASDIGDSLLKAKLPVILGRASVPPLDNLTCPAIAIELAPLVDTGSKITPASDPAYQQRAAEAIAAALTAWRTENAADGGAQ